MVLQDSDSVKLDETYHLLQSMRNLGYHHLMDLYLSTNVRYIVVFTFPDSVSTSHPEIFMEVSEFQVYIIIC